MSIIIKSLDSLPEHCYDCPCHNKENGYCQANKDYTYSIDRPFWCPLLEIHPNVTFMEKKFNINAESEDK